MQQKAFTVICEAAFVAACIAPFLMPTTMGMIAALAVLTVVIVAHELSQHIQSQSPVVDNRIRMMEEEAENTEASMLDIQRQLTEHEEELDRLRTTQGLKSII